MQVFLDAVSAFTSDAADDSTDPIVTFDSVAVLAPRGRFTIELYSNHLKLGGPVRPFPFPLSNCRFALLCAPNLFPFRVGKELDGPLMILCLFFFLLR